MRHCVQSLEAVSGMSELYLLMMESVKGSLAVMSGVLVIAFLGLLVSLVLVVGVKTQQRLLLLPWQAGISMITKSGISDKTSNFEFLFPGPIFL
jgi:hypothetical protein